MRRRKVVNWRFIRACVSLFLWSVIVFFILIVDPALKGAVIVFLILFFIFLVFLISVLTDNLRRVFSYPLFIVLYFVLGYFGVGNILNLFFLFGILITVELYFWRE